MREKHAPKKHFGQNFLTAPHYIEQIVNAVPANKGDTVIEIGPGKGALSTRLVKKGFNFTMVEKDRDVIPHLKEALGEGDFTIINDDATRFDFSSLGEQFHAVGNLPYNVASTIIKSLLFHAGALQSGTFMVQKEVADRIVATAGGKTIGFMTILLTYFGEVKKLFDVPPGAFFPKPKVTSAVFQILLKPECYERLPREEWHAFLNFVSVAYQMRRKKLSNSVAKFVKGREAAVEAIVAAGLDENVRPEGLQVQQWVDLYKQIL